MPDELARTPPHNIEAEQSLLGSIFLDKDAMFKISDVAGAEDFYKDAHRYIYEIMIELHDRHEPIDILTVGSRLEEKKQLEAVGGRSYLITLTNIVPSSYNIVHYAQIVHKKATLRRLIGAAGDITRIGYDESQELETVLDLAQQTLFSVSQKFLKQTFQPIRNILTDAFDRIDELHKEKGKLRGVPTGFKALDNLLAGLQKSNLVVLAARPSVGKTSLALDMARQVAIHAKVPVGILSLEMSKEELVDRLICAEANVSLWKMRTGNLSDREDHDDFPRIGNAMGVLSEAPIYIDDAATNTISQIRTKARRLKTENNLGLLIIDYLQLIDSRTKIENRVQEISEITRSLKMLARELNIPVLALSQLSRSVEMSKPAIPKLAHLRESGCLTGDTKIILADGTSVTIQKLAERKKQTPVTILALNQKYKIQKTILTKAFSSGKKKVYILTTRSGRKISASANHPFRTIDGWVHLDKLKKGNLISLPRMLPFTHTRGGMSRDELALLAHLIGDGCILPRQPFHYTSADETNIAVVKKCAEKLFKIKTRLVRQKNWWHLYLPSPHALTHGVQHPISNWLVSLGLDLAHAPDKRLPDFLAGQSPEDIAFFLKHLWSTDGNISWKKLKNRLPSTAIYYSSTSEQLCRQVQHLLLKLNIWSTLRRVPQGKHRPSFQVHIQSKKFQIRFLQLIGAIGERGRIIPDILKALTKITTNTNTDVIPKSIWRTHVAKALKKRGISWRDLSEKLEMSYSGTSLFKNNIGRERLARIARIVSDDELMHLAQSDIYWDEIISIAYEGEKEVYDATVPGLHNFVANDIVVHNSIEQDADVVMFIYRKAADRNYRVEDIPPDERFLGEIHVAKHRNGPTGIVKLFFDAEKASYRNLEKYLTAEQT